MRICIATGIFPPAISEPAQYAAAMATEFAARGHQVDVVTVEATAAGIPVITTNVGVAPEIFENGKTGIVIEPIDMSALVMAVSNVFEQKISLT